MLPNKIRIGPKLVKFQFGDFLSGDPVVLLEINIGDIILLGFISSSPLFRAGETKEKENVALRFDRTRTSRKECVHLTGKTGTRQ